MMIAKDHETNKQDKAIAVAIEVEKNKETLKEVIAKTNDFKRPKKESSTQTLLNVNGCWDVQDGWILPISKNIQARNRWRKAFNYARCPSCKGSGKYIAESLALYHSLLYESLNKKKEEDVLNVLDEQYEAAIIDHNEVLSHHETNIRHHVKLIRTVESELRHQQNLPHYHHVKHDASNHGQSHTNSQTIHHPLNQEAINHTTLSLGSHLNTHDSSLKDRHTFTLTPTTMNLPAADDIITSIDRNWNIPDKLVIFLANLPPAMKVSTPRPYSWTLRQVWILIDLKMKSNRDEMKFYMYRHKVPKTHQEFSEFVMDYYLKKTAHR